MENTNDILTKEITCKRCGKSGNFTMYPIIDFQNEELTQKTFSLELFKYVCPHCGAITIVQYDTIIVDLFKKNLIYLYTNDNLETFYNEILPRLKTHFEETEDIKKILNEIKHTRVVTSLNELLEKLLIFDYDLDDRVIELVKYGLIQNKNLQEFNCIKIYFDKMEKEKLLFTCIGKDNKAKGIGIDAEHYNSYIDSCKIIPEKPNIDFAKIDETLVNQIIKNIESNN